MLNTETLTPVNEPDVVATRPPVSITGKRVERIALAALLLLYLASTYGFAVVTPYGESPDEYSHLFYIESLVRFNTFPTIAKESISAEAFQTPLYYLGGALIVDAGRVLTGKKLNAPLAPLPHGKSELVPGVDLSVLVHPPDERWPFTVYVLRTYSILLGLGVILLTYATARLLVPWPAPATVPLLATAIVALIPQANFIRASVTSENMAEFVGALLVWLMVLHLTKAHSQKRVFWLGVGFGAALLGKLTVIPLILPLLWVLWVRKDGGRRGFIRDVVIVSGLALLTAGWLFAYRWVAYGDPLGYLAWTTQMPRDNVFTWADLFWFKDPFAAMIWNSFWGVFGWQQIFLPDWIYTVILVVVLLAIGGGVYLLARRALSLTQQRICFVILLTMFLLYVFIIQSSTYAVSWQGREVFAALSSICILIGLGLGTLALGRAAVQPAPVSTLRFALSQGLLATVILSMFALNLYSILGLNLPILNP